MSHRRTEIQPIRHRPKTCYIAILIHVVKLANLFRDVNETRAFETDSETETRSLETETINNWSRDVSRPRPVSRL